MAGASWPEGYSACSSPFLVRNDGTSGCGLRCPAPSGARHMGHARVYTIGDALARYLRMRGYDVLHPIGFDALGLPAENAAIKDGRHPAERTPENIATLRADMQMRA